MRKTIFLPDGNYTVLHLLFFMGGGDVPCAEMTL